MIGNYSCYTYLFNIKEEKPRRPLQLPSIESDLGRVQGFRTNLKGYSVTFK